MGLGADVRVYVDNVSIKGIGGVGTGSDCFDDWIADFDVGGQTGFADDPDGDGNGNGVENYYGTDPSSFTPGVVAGRVGSEGGNTYNFTHPLSASPADDITASYQWSADLVTFYGDGATEPGGTNVRFSQVDVSGGTATVVATVTGTSVDVLFVRIVVEQASP